MSESHRNKVREKKLRRERAHRRVRQRIKGTLERPRLSVHKSLRYIYAQIIDDLNGQTLAQANSAENEVRSELGGSPVSLEAAKAVGEIIADRARSKGIEKVVFDRGGAIYHGRVKALAEGARSKGLVF